MTRIRILHFIDTLGAGGAERQLVYLLENLDRARYDCHVLTTYDTFRHYQAALHQLGIPTYSLHHGDLAPLNRVGALARYIRLMWKVQPHIVHSWLHYPNLIARAARPLCPSHRLITAVRTEYTLRQRASECLTSWLSDFRIVNNNQTKKTNFKSNTLYIPNGVSLPTHNSPVPRSTMFTALMVARIDPRKDHLTLLRALSNLPENIRQNFRMILIGEITEPTTQTQIDSTITALNLSTLVQQLPSTHDMTSYYAQADVTILPSNTEGFSNVILESFASAAPVIASEAANSAGLIQHGVNGWIFPTRDSLQLATQIEAVWNTSHQQRAQMGQNGRAVAEQYSISRMVEQYIDLYDRALSRS